eukprot:g6533.t1
MRVMIKPDFDSLSLWAAEYIKTRIKQFSPTQDKPYFVLGLPRGSGSCSKVFQYLVQFYRKGELSFANCVSFNIDEFVGVEKDFELCTHLSMWNNLLKHVDIPPQNVYILDGLAENLEVECRNFELAIEEFGGIDLLFCGVGDDGHIARNEPGSSLSSLTRVKKLNQSTVNALSERCVHRISVPKFALTMGVATILSARELMIVFSSNAKSQALHRCLEGGINHMFPASALQLHSRCLFLATDDAVDGLQMKTIKYFSGVDRVARDVFGEEAEKLLMGKPLHERKRLQSEVTERLRGFPNQFNNGVRNFHQKMCENAKREMRKKNTLKK